MGGGFCTASEDPKQTSPFEITSSFLPQILQLGGEHGPIGHSNLDFFQNECTQHNAEARLPENVRKLSARSNAAARTAAGQSLTQTAADKQKPKIKSLWHLGLLAQKLARAQVQRLAQVSLEFHHRSFHSNFCTYREAGSPGRTK